MCNMFRLLTAGEIECRVAQAGQSGNRVWCSVLIFKDARVDQRLLDEVVGPMNWKNEYSVIDGKIFCTVSIWDAKKGEWISKQNVGVESNTEKEKGQASDAFKRACFNWGIGRELYSAPKIYIDLKDGEYAVRDGKVKCRSDLFFVREFGCDEHRNVNKLVVIDKTGTVRFSMDAERQAVASTLADSNRTVYESADGKRIYEGGNAWNKAAARVAAGETCEDGTPISVMMQEYFRIPDDAMRRFFALVEQLKEKAEVQAASPGQ